jgi:hypothetical protein
MVGFSVQTDHAGNQEGVIIYTDKDRVFLTKIEAGMLAKFIQEGRRYWKPFKLPHLVPSSELTLEAKEGK